MAIPDFQSLMLPLLKLASNRQPWRIRDLTDKLADEFKLTQEERAELLPSGGSLVFSSRVSWARTYMTKAGLLASPARGQTQITERGLQVLAENHASVSVKMLTRYPEFIEFHKGSSNPDADAKTVVSNVAGDTSPQEQLEQSYLALMSALTSDIVDTLKSVSPLRFEQIVVDVVTAMGYGGNRQEAGKAIGKTGDKGIDGIINEDRLGLDAIYLQAKRWDSDVGAGDIRDFKGALDGHGASKGVFITTAGFTKAALDEVSRSRNYKIVLIDGQRLARLMIEHNVGVSSTATYSIKKLDTDYFSDE